MSVTKASTTETTFGVWLSTVNVLNGETHDMNQGGRVKFKLEAESRDGRTPSHVRLFWGHAELVCMSWGQFVANLSELNTLRAAVSDVIEPAP